MMSKKSRLLTMVKNVKWILFLMWGDEIFAVEIEHLTIKGKRI
jgi:hypothetical protein